MARAWRVVSLATPCESRCKIHEGGRRKWEEEKDLPIGSFSKCFNKIAPARSQVGKDRPRKNSEAGRMPTRQYGSYMKRKGSKRRRCALKEITFMLFVRLHLLRERTDQGTTSSLRRGSVCSICPTHGKHLSSCYWQGREQIVWL